MTIDGALTSYAPIPGKSIGAMGITSGPDGALWFGLYTAGDDLVPGRTDSVGRITIPGLPPEFTSCPEYAASSGSEFEFQLTTAGEPLPFISVAPDTRLPDGVTLTNNGDGTATLDGKAGLTHGKHTVVLQATNGVAGPAATQSFTLNVTGPPRLQQGLHRAGGGRLFVYLDDTQSADA